MSNLEIATLSLVIAFLMWSLFSSSVRPSILNIAKILLGTKILSVVALYLIYSTCLIYLVYKLHFWDSKLLKVTVITFLVVGIPMVFNSTNIESGTKFVKRTISQTLGLSAILAYFANLSSIPIYVDVLLMLILITFSLISVVAKDRENARELLNFTKVIVFIISVVFLTSASFNMNHILRRHDALSTIRDFGVTLWLPILLIPFIYLLGFFGQCELLYRMLPFFNDRKKLSIPVRVAIFFGFHMRIELISSFKSEWRLQTSELQTYGETREFMRRFRSAIRKAD